MAAESCINAPRMQTFHYDDHTVISGGTAFTLFVAARKACIFTSNPTAGRWSAQSCSSMSTGLKNGRDCRVEFVSIQVLSFQAGAVVV